MPLEDTMDDEGLTADSEESESPSVADDGFTEMPPDDVSESEFFSLVSDDGIESPAYTISAEDGTMVTMVDRDQDGTFEQALLDIDGDEDWEVSLTFDDQGSVMAMQVDRNNNGLFRTTWLPGEGKVIYQNAEGDIKRISTGPPPWQFQEVYNVLEAESSTDLPTPEVVPVAEPAEMTDATFSDVFGDAEYELQFAKEQSENGICVPVSVNMILDEFGLDLHENEVVERAVTMGLLTEGSQFGRWSGMTSQDAVILLEAYGIDAELEHGQLSDLKLYLREGRDVIITLDSSEVWTGADDDFRDASGGADHALVITEIDEANQTVTMNDPGHPEGAGREMPLSLFEDAWDDSGNEMVVTQPVPRQETAQARAALPEPGPVLLPVALTATVVQGPEDEGARGSNGTSLTDTTGDGSPNRIRLSSGTTLSMEDSGLVTSVDTGAADSGPSTFSLEQREPESTVEDTAPLRFAGPTSLTFVDPTGVPSEVPGEDLDGDGVEESVRLDSDGDGAVDAEASDTDEDGLIDRLAIDANVDGVADAVMVDPDGTGDWTEQAIDPSTEVAPMTDESRLVDPPIRDLPDTGNPALDLADLATQGLVNQGIELWHLAHPGQAVPTDAEGYALNPPEMTVAVLEGLETSGLKEDERLKMEAAAKELSDAWFESLRTAIQ